MIAEEVGNVDVWRTLVSEIINPVLFHRVAMPKSQQAGELCKMLGDSGDPHQIWTDSALQMCILCLFGPSQLCVRKLSKC